MTVAAPTDHFLVLSFTYTCGISQVTFVCVTDVPCNMTAHITDQRPAIRRVPTTKRGADFTLSSLTCFVGIKTVTQSEAGDTLTHTFVIPLSAYDVTFYWYLTATYGGKPSQSMSQIFWHSCPKPTYPPATAKFYSYPAGPPTTVDGDVYRYNVSEPYLTIRNGNGTNAWVNTGAWNVNINYASAPGNWSMLSRVKATFDLTPIPLHSIILSASFKAFCWTKTTYAMTQCSYALFQAPAPPYNAVPITDYQAFGTNQLSTAIPYAWLANQSWTTWPILAAKLSLIQPGQLVSIGLREATYDAPALPPTWGLYKTAQVQWLSANNPTYPTLRPYLEITYQQL